VGHADDSLYERYRAAIADEELPCAAVDLDAVERNTDTLLAPVRRANKKLRIATKSLRCLAVVRAVLERGGDVTQGLMAYSAREASFLVEQGFSDVLLAYPTVNERDLDLVARANASGATLSVVVDDVAQLGALSAAGRRSGTRIPAIVEVDMAYRALGGRVHLGVRRSPIHTADDVVRLAEALAASDGARFHGVMGYEAQIAGLGDANPFDPRMNGPKRAIRAVSRGHVRRLRGEIDEKLRARGLPPTVFNGGGTGSLDSSTEEPWLTEVTAGSGFVDSHLFDYYRHLTLTPALFFALQIVRRPGPGFVTCAGGGYIASGPPSLDRLPIPWLPRGLSLVGMEGAGEVQTPLIVPEGMHLDLGDVVLFRHAKAGELAEHFEDYVLLRGGKKLGRAPTYRGMGKRFL
jgi:D-serine deaminase-like pyridoxal phosphate-dependent protein